MSEVRSVGNGQWAVGSKVKWIGPKTSERVWIGEITENNHTGCVRVLWPDYPLPSIAVLEHLEPVP